MPIQYFLTGKYLNLRNNGGKKELKINFCGNGNEMLPWKLKELNFQIC